ncbi:MAG TPA: glyoxalase [Planctomycetaceae bacterium]|nr:glyoxalase [Planctomycetaceae bacterium]
MKYAHTNIVCRDWKKLSAFYVDVFDCEIVPPIRKQSGDWLAQGTGVKDANLEGVHLLLPGYGRQGPTLEIFQYLEYEEQPDLVPNARGFGHIAFEVDDVEEILAALLKAGGSKLGSPTSRHVEGVGKLTFVYCRDPEGNTIELQNWKRTMDRDYEETPS